MSKTNKLERIPIIKDIVHVLKKINIPGLEGMTLYKVIEVYFIGIGRGILTTRAGAIAYSFFMAIFPFALFTLSLIPYIPLEGFQEGLFTIIQDFVPPKTFAAVEDVLNDIIKNQYSGLLSFGFLTSIFLMTNGVNAIFGGFENSYHIKRDEYRSVIKTYLISIAVSIIMSIFLIATVTIIILYEISLVKMREHGWFNETSINLFYYGRIIVIIGMIFIVVALLFRYGTKEGRQKRFASAGTILTTILMMLLFYLFSIYVLEFAKYNQLYGAVGTLLILMLFVWLNSIILLLGFELDATILKLKKSQKNR